ncbi:MAG: hypothetical protein LV480_13140 [Methylacidiphilales bacterium]|nr:hypothetical protein [Candidatus Methylacidiphilales bacterium]
MSVSTTPPPAAQKKRGLGCFGIGCLILALLVILFVALIGGGCYLGYTKIAALTSKTPTDIPSFNGSDDVYNAAQQKIVEFGHDVENHQAATIQLNADEINTLIARNPEVIRQQARLYVSLANDQVHAQGSIPTDALVQGFFKDRFVNFDATFDLNFNADTRNIELSLHHLQIGDQTTPENLLPTMQAEITPLLNAELQKFPPTQSLLEQTKSIGVKDGELVIQTQ